MFNNLKHFIEKILSFNIGNLFKAEINNKIADTVTDNKLIEYNKTENNNNVMQQNFHIAIFNGLNYQDALMQSFLKGNKNAEAIGNEVYKLLKDNNVSQDKIQEKLSNPEFISTMAKANEIAYTIDDLDKRKLLSDLIYQKYITDDEYDSNVISQAISLMKNLTKSHLKIIAFLYLFQSNYVKYNTNSKNFLEFYDKYIEPLVDFPFKKLQELGITILGNGIAVAFTLGWDIISYLPNSFYDALTGKLYDINLDIKTKIVHLGSIWKELATSSSKLTSVGKCIGKTYLHDILGLDVVEQIETKTKSNGITHSDLARIHNARYFIKRKKF